MGKSVLWASTAGPAVWNPRVQGRPEWGYSFLEEALCHQYRARSPTPVLSPVGFLHGPGLWAVVLLCRAVACRVGTLKLRAHPAGAHSRFSTVACCEVTSGGDTTVVWGARPGGGSVCLLTGVWKSRFPSAPSVSNAGGESSAGGSCPGGPRVQLWSRICRAFPSTVTHGPPF